MQTIDFNTAVVYADYYANDPYYTSKRWNQLFYLNKKDSKWLITKCKAI